MREEFGVKIAEGELFGGKRLTAGEFYLRV